MTSSPRRPQGPAELVDDAGREAVRRIARRSVAWWRTRTAEGRPRAAAVEELVAALAIYEHAVEIGAGPPPAGGYRVPPPPPREDALVDRLTVVAYDLALALAAAGPDAPARLPDGVVPVREAAGRALAECLLATYEVDPRPVEGRYLDAVLSGGPGPLADAVRALPRAGEA